MTNLTPKERHVMEHATGWRHTNRLYRNHYTAGPEQDTWPVLQALCRRGLMRSGQAEAFLGGMTTFTVTKVGIAELEQGELRLPDRARAELDREGRGRR